MSAEPSRLETRARAVFATAEMQAAYQIEGVLGEGGMGIVFLARQTDLQRQVAVKCVVRSAFGDDVDVGRFRREAAILARLSHPGLGALYTVGDTEDMVYIVSEYVPAASLRKRLQSGRLSVAEACRVIVDVAETLHYVHGKGLVHRDVKPDNILLPDAGGVRVIDFGLAREYQGGDSSDQLTRAGQVVGTPAYMSPEAVRAEALDPRADVYSLAVVLFELVVGRPPFDGSPLEVLQAHLSTPPPRARRLRRELPQGFDGLFARALAKNPDERHPSAQAFAAAVKAVVAAASTDDLDVTLCPPPPPDAGMQSACEEPVAGRRPQQRRAATAARDHPTDRRPIRVAATGVLLALGLVIVMVGVLWRRPVTAVSGALAPPAGLETTSYRGRLELTWRDRGAVGTVELRPERGGDWRSEPVTDGGVTVDGLVPGQRYQFRFRAADGRLSRSSSIVTVYSCLSVQSQLVPTDRAGTGSLVFASERPMVLSFLWRRGNETGRTPMPTAPCLRHQLDVAPGMPPFGSLTVEGRDARGTPVRPHLPTLELASLIERAAAVDVEAVLERLRTELPGIANPRHDEAQRQRALQEALHRIEVLRPLLLLAPFTPVVLADEDVPDGRRLALAQHLLNLVSLDALAEWYRAGAVFAVDDMLAPDFAYRHGAPTDGVFLVDITRYGDEPQPFIPSSYVGGRGEHTLITNAPLLFPHARRPIVRQTLEFDVPAGELDRAAGTEIVVAAHLFMPCFVLSVRLNDRVVLPFRHPWGRLDPGRMNRDDAELIHVAQRRRSFPSGLLHGGRNRIDVTVHSVTGTTDPQVPVVTSVKLALTPR